MIDESIETNTAEQVQAPDYVYIDESYHPLYVTLRESREGEKHPPFKGMKNLFMLAAFVGFLEEKWVPLGTNPRNIFARTVFKEDDLSLLRALVLTKTENPEVLTNEREIQRIAEGYANGGIILIKEHIEEAPGNRVENLVNLLLNWEPYTDLISSIQ
jgi:dnd system-associated protein 4